MRSLMFISAFHAMVMKKRNKQQQQQQLCVIHSIYLNINSTAQTRRKRNINVAGQTNVIRIPKNAHTQHLDNNC